MADLVKLASAVVVVQLSIMARLTELVSEAELLEWARLAELASTVCMGW